MESKRIIQVYEELLAQNPVYRKKIGAFYTPAYIVNYMVEFCVLKCFENKTEQQINEVRIIDPACGGGAFLVGAYEYLLAYFGKIRQKILSLSERKTILFNHIFGVDIDNEALIVCKQALLMICYQQNSIDTLNVLELDQNIKYGNSLVSRFTIDADIKQALKKSKWTIDTYKIAVDTYRNAQNKEQKREMERLISDIKLDFRTEINKNDPKLAKLYKLNRELTTLTTQQSIFGRSDKEKKEWNKKITQLTEETKKLETEIEDIKTNKIFENAFEWRFEFPEVLNENGDFVGFDVVIGNPPYISNKEMHKLQMQDIIQYINQNYFSSKSGNYDLYIPFIELGLSILKPNSKITYILPNKLMIAKYSQSLLKLIESNYSFISYTDFSNINVFEDASVYPIVIKISKTPKIDEKQITQKISIVVNKTIEVISTEPYDFLNHRLLNEKNSLEGILLLKIENIAKLEEELIFSPGINGFQFTNYGKCIKEGSKEDNSRRVIVTGTIDRYCILKKVVRYKRVDYKSPFIYNDPLIISQGKWELFSTPKIVVAGMTKVIEATLDEFGELAPGVSVYSIIGKIEILKYVLGILNSKLINWYFRNRFNDKHLAGGYISMNTVLLQKIPICKSKDTKQFISIVEQILSIKGESETANTTALETQIDHLVYQLYELTEEEIKIIEGS